MYGYSGNILHIDLKERTHWVENKPEEWYKIYIGGVSMATRLCWENIEVGCDPYAPGNPVLFCEWDFHRYTGPCWREIWPGFQIAIDRLYRRQPFRFLVLHCHEKSSI